MKALIQQVVEATDDVAFDEAQKYARRTLKSWGIDLDEMDADGIADCEPYWHLMAQYQQEILARASLAGMSVTGRPQHLFNMPQAADLRHFIEETDKAVWEILNSLDERQLRQLVYTMLRDPNNKIDLDNWVNYFV